MARVLSHEGGGAKRGSGETRTEPCAGTLEPRVDGDDRRPHARPKPREAVTDPARRCGDPRRPILDLELEHLGGRVDRLDPLREDDALPVEARAQDERGRPAPDGVDGDAADDADPRPARTDDEALRPREPVLEDVAAPLEDVLPHVPPIPRPRALPNLRPRSRI
ncbi:MAG TPA: hypothetical protein VFK17_07470 [Gaiellaceae bacterium]|nr:hypothetical protein [Gaiellaceae bacterium]